ncbi:hypothetical protein E1295_10395 [Nonomuraea mesophila]|uniref:Uncharacterized protein n=1 Tax=Nonomuraea mesophila TaxID=2530382 RepID=A0A4R5FUC7_9ACTN|nr:hypothetical protein [Nonomuraea mesophila]TDE56564.1 hypothetical protein E1295_10395 [Nonomuraea mesophila]
MTDYRLDGLSTRTFEHLIQALAVGEISTLVTPFGDGPDGGREATFDGLTDYGPKDDKWSGYGVIQAKFLSRTRSSRHDGQWALKALRKELAEYSKKDSSRKMPAYYIFATNVVLTPTDSTGSKDQLLSLLRQFANRHNLRGYDIWDYDKIRILIDRDINEGVRRAYAAWITPGDVLAQLSDHLKGASKDYYNLLVNFLQKELVGDQYARLEQAGNSADEAIPLSQVFIDLPTSVEPVDGARERAHSATSRQFVAFIIDEARNLFATSNNVPMPHTGPTPGRYVLIGGPGQGKTTVGQYVCQLFRASLLSDVSPELLSPEARETLAAVISTWQRGKGLTQTARRIPFRVVLSEFAAALAENTVNGLLEFLALKFSKRAGTTVSQAQVQRLLEQYPCVLVLDGLDEVPGSTNRDDVLGAVSDFWVDVATSEIDALVIATSRPQGYNDDFSPAQYSHHYLIPLDKSTALLYGKKLAEVRFGSDDDRLARVCSRLQRAVETPATARLMRSPLQVTIITLLVDRIGQPPEERWALFREYYKLIFHRETERDIPSVRVLKENSTEVHAIHRRVGLLLQTESERSGGTEARLTTEQFTKMVEEYLIEEGYEGEALVQLKKDIIEAAGQRLVFLVGLELGQVGFEIRSLQEFMAAEGLMEGSDHEVQARLKEVAASSNWRNVLLFAAGRVFEERQYLRDTIESICVNMNDDPDDPISPTILGGSDLALDLLEDGPARRQPKKRGSLTRLALQLLDKPGAHTVRRLADIYLPQTDAIFMQEIEKRLESRNEISLRSAWQCLALLLDQSESKVAEAGRAFIIDNISRPDVFRSLINAEGIQDEWLADRLLEEFPSQAAIGPVLESFSMPHAHQEPRTYGPWLLSKAPPWLAWYAKYELGHFLSLSESHAVTVNLKQGGRLIGSLASLRSAHPSRSSNLVPPPDFPTSTPAWRWIKDAGDFCLNPNHEMLASLINALGDPFLAQIISRQAYRRYPWPLAECLNAVSAGAAPSAVAECVHSGKFGMSGDWIRLEERWHREGLDISELLDAEPILTLDDEPHLYLLPIQSMMGPSRIQKSAIPNVVSAYTAATPGPIRNMLGHWLIEREIEALLRGAPTRRIPHLDNIIYDLLAKNSYVTSMLWEFLGVLDLTDRRWSDSFATLDPGDALYFFPGRRDRLAENIEQIFASNTQLQGLLIPLSQTERTDSSAGRLIQALAENLSDTDTPAVRCAKLLILLQSGFDVASLQHEIAPILVSSPTVAVYFAEAISSRGGPYSRDSSDLVSLLSLMPEGSIKSLLSFFQIMGNRRRSRLGEREVWSALGLPGHLLDVL